MTEIEKQENQKTVVAFIAGLLIGGLLVWIFSSTPETKEANTDQNAEEENETSTVSKENVAQVSSGMNTSSPVATADASIAILDQKAGKAVTLGTIKYPAKSGWIVIRDYMDGVPGNILGAARYNTDEGLIPTSIELMRQTTPDNTYQASFFTNEGAIGFKLGEDKPVEGVSSNFKVTN